MARPKSTKSAGHSYGNLGFNARLWLASLRRHAVACLAVRGINADVGRDLHPDPRAACALTNPPFSPYRWFRTDDNVSGAFGLLTARSACFRLEQ